MGGQGSLSMGRATKHNDAYRALGGLGGAGSEEIVSKPFFSVIMIQTGVRGGEMNTRKAVKP